MPFNLTTFTKSLNSSFQQLEKTQAQALSIEIAANFVAGRTAGEKHQSFSVQHLLARELPANKLNIEPVNQTLTAQDPPEEEGLTTEEKEELAILTALFLGYLSEFNSRAKDQILTTVKSMVDESKTQDEIKQYVDSILSGEEPVIIDNVGKKKKEIYVDKNLKLSEVTKIVSKPFFSSVLVYASLLGEMAAHRAYETGRKTINIKNGFESWVFVGPADERARAHHVAILGNVFTWGTEQSEYAERCLQEPRCRHRAVTYFGDSRDTPKEKWQKLKDDAGLRWSDEKEEWVID